MHQIATQFRAHQTLQAFEEFARFEERLPAQAQSVFTQLKRLNPQLADPKIGFYNREGFSSSNHEKAEALTSAAQSISRKECS